MKKRNRLIKIIMILAALSIVIVLAVGSTFSWYTPETSTNTNKYSLLKYNINGKVNNSDLEDSSVATYLGENENGVVTYGETPITSANNGNVVNIPAGEDQVYFKTVISDISGNGTSVLSLWLNSLIYSGSGNIQIGIFSPEKTFVSYDGNDLSRVCIEDNLMLAANDHVDVYWYVKVPASDTAQTLTIGAQYPVYN